MKTTSKTVPKKIRLGFIGAGWWATANHMPILKKRDDVEFVGVASLGLEQLKQVQEMFGFRFATEDYRELLELDLDAVVVTTPHHLHFEHALAAVKRGLHVMVEKPFALNAADAWTLERSAREAGVQVLVPYGWNYRPFTREAKRLMQTVGVGQIEFVMCHMASPTKGLFVGKANFASFDWKPTLFEADPRTWQSPELGGGYAHGQITHSSALLFWLTGLRAKTVSARMTKPNSRVDLYDAAHVEFEHGAIGTISGAATLPDGDKYQLDLRIFGSEGVLLLDVERERLELRRHDGNHHHLSVPDGEGIYVCNEPPHRFMDVIQGRASNDSNAEIGAKTVELLEAMHHSAASNAQSVVVFDE